MIKYGFLSCLCLAMLGVGLAQNTSSQTLPKPSRTAYKCTIGGKTTYSDDPCLGAEVIHIEPMRGLNKSTGKELAGADVVRERNAEIMAGALAPLTGMSTSQHETFRRRFTLSPDAKAECGSLDTRIAQLEARERLASADMKARIRQNLYDVRRRQRALFC